jgi:hypothetical protein
MRQQYADSYITKFEDPFTAFLYEVSMDACDDEFGGIDDFGYWVGRLGRHFLIEDSNGLVYRLKREHGTSMLAFVNDYFGVERVDEYMNDEEDN